MMEQETVVCAGQLIFNAGGIAVIFVVVFALLFAYVTYRNTK